MKNKPGDLYDTCVKNDTKAYRLWTSNSHERYSETHSLRKYPLPFSSLKYFRFTETMLVLGKLSERMETNLVNVAESHVVDGTMISIGW
jgi:hypothetical protein